MATADFQVYVLFSDSLGKIYIGQTQSLDDRLAIHNNPGLNNMWTAQGIPWIWLGSIKVKDRGIAMLLERRLKGLKNPKRVKAILERQRLPHLWGIEGVFVMPKATCAG